MAETFDCPKCGAPINFDPEQHLDQETMTCPYCGDSIIIPANLRRSSPIPTEREEIYTSIPTNTVVINSPGRSITRGCVTGVIIAALIIGAVGIFIATSIKGNFNEGFGGAQPTTANPQVAVNKILTSVAGQLTAIPISALVNTPTPAISSTPAASSTPTIDTTATAQIANNTLYEQQSNWPVVLQEKFINNLRNWDTGTTNDSFALSNLSVAGEKYTWQITSKKPMLTYAFPQMTAQTDLLVSADLQMTSTNANPQDEAGIIFRYTDKDNTFYFFGVNPVGTYLLTIFDGTNFNDLISNTQTNLLKPNQVNHLAVSMQGDQILLVINNVVVDSYQDSQLTSGYGGLGANLAAAGEDATFIFTNFYVRAPKQ